MSKLKISRKAFRDWLAENSDLVFDRQKACRCPIAIYLGAECDHDVIVDYEGVEIDKVKYQSPPWVMRFIVAVDLQPGRITAKTALKYL